MPDFGECSTLARQGVTVRSSGDGVGLSSDRIRLDADLYEMKTDIGMQSMHPQMPGDSADLCRER